MRQYPAGLQSQLGASPVSPLGVVPDGVASPHPAHNSHNLLPHHNCDISPDPLGDGTVLLHLLGKLTLDTEGLQSGHVLERSDGSEEKIELKHKVKSITTCK